jgi:hypothetical protein
MLQWESEQRSTSAPFELLQVQSSPVSVEWSSASDNVFSQPNFTSSSWSDSRDRIHSENSLSSSISSPIQTKILSPSPTPTPTPKFTPSSPNTTIDMVNPSFMNKLIEQTITRNPLLANERPLSQTIHESNQLLMSSLNQDAPSHAPNVNPHLSHFHPSFPTQLPSTLYPVLQNTFAQMTQVINLNSNQQNSLDSFFPRDIRENLVFLFIPGLYSGYFPGDKGKPDYFKTSLDEVEFVSFLFPIINTSLL